MVTHCSLATARKKRDIYLLWFIAVRLSLARYKITADILMTFAGGFFAEEIEDRVAIMFVVQIEVSFVSTRRESDKPEKINISVLSDCYL